MPGSKATAPCCPPSVKELRSRPIHGTAADDEFSQLCDALSHPARVKIMQLLTSRNSCICGEIVNEVGLAQSTVSQHLKVLRDIGLIRGEIDGPKTCYCIDHEVLRRFKILAAGL